MVKPTITEGTSLRGGREVYSDLRLRQARIINKSLTRKIVKCQTDVLYLHYQTNQTNANAKKKQEPNR